MERLQAERRLAGLVEAGLSLASALDVDTLLQRIADLAREVIGAHYAAVGILDSEGLLGRFVHSGVDEETAKAIGDVPRGRGVLGVIIQEGRPLRLRSIQDHPQSAGFPPHHPEMHTFLGVPVVGRQGVLGRLYFSEKTNGGEFTKDDERIAMTFAAQAGVALDNARLYEDIRKRSEELARRVSELGSVERVAQLLISGTTIEEALESAASEARSLTGATRVVIALLEGRSQDLVIRITSGDVVAHDLVGTLLPATKSKAYAVMMRGASELVDDMSADEEVHPEVLRKLGNPKRGAFIPIVIRGRGVGTLAAYDSLTGAPFSEDDRAVLQIIANQVAIAVENERLTDALRDLAVLEERERISKELHDGVIQSIYSVGLSLQGSMSLLDKDPDRARKRVDEAIATLDDVVRDVRSYIFQLRPKLIEERGLAAALRELAKDYEVNTLARSTVDIDRGACEQIPGGQETHVIQIAREVLSNIARHAQASHVEIRCLRERDHIRLTIEDDGRGFDPATVERGQGLSNMEARARTVAGSLSIEPREPTGMRHELRIPLDDTEGA